MVDNNGFQIYLLITIVKNKIVLNYSYKCNYKLGLRLYNTYEYKWYAKISNLRTFTWFCNIVLINIILKDPEHDWHNGNHSHSPRF